MEKNSGQQVNSKSVMDENLCYDSEKPPLRLKQYKKGEPNIDGELQAANKIRPSFIGKGEVPIFKTRLENYSIICLDRGNIFHT